MGGDRYLLTVTARDCCLSRAAAVKHKDGVRSCINTLAACNRVASCFKNLSVKPGLAQTPFIARRGKSLRRVSVDSGQDQSAIASQLQLKLYINLKNSS